jgi:hypothetical protein
VTFQLVAECLNHYATACPTRFKSTAFKIFGDWFSLNAFYTNDRYPVARRIGNVNSPCLIFSLDFNEREISI